MADVSKGDLDFLARSITLARDNVEAGRGGPFGALVVRAGEIIAEGANLVTEHCDPTAHAEVVAIREACRKTGDFRLADCTIFSSCEPCPMCLGAIHWSRMGRLVFAATRHDAARAGFDDALLYSELVLPLDDRATATLHVAHEEALSPFSVWMTSGAKVLY